MANRLYIVEGLPCSGKSTTAGFISDNLTGRKVCFVDEGTGNHPADYEFHAFLSVHNFALMPPDAQERVSACSERTKKGYIIPLSRVQGEHFDLLLKYKIYDFLPWQVEMPLMLEKWQSFVRNADKDSVYVFNCVLLQNPMCETMMRFGFSAEQSFDYIRKIADIVKPMNPVVVYLKNDDIAECIRRTSAQRDGWLDGVIDYHVNGAYGRSINAQGFDGYIECLRERQKRELAILAGLPVDSVVIDNPHRCWSEAYEKIKKICV